MRARAPLWTATVCVTALLLLTPSCRLLGSAQSHPRTGEPELSGRQLAGRLVQRALVFEGVILHEQTVKRVVFDDCNGGREWVVPPVYEYHCVRVAVTDLLVGILPAETLVVAVDVSLTDVRDPDARAGAKLAFFGDFACSAGDTGLGRIAVASGFWGRYQFAAFHGHGDVISGPLPTSFSREDLLWAARQPRQLARARELSSPRSLPLARVTGNVTYATWKDSVQIEPLRSLYGPVPTVSPLRLAFESGGCGVDLRLGDTLVVPLRDGEPEPGHLKPLCLEDLCVRNGFVKQFGSRFDRVVERCYRATAAGLEPRLHSPR